MKTLTPPNLTDITFEILCCSECGHEVTALDVMQDKERMHFDDDGAMITIPSLLLREDQRKEFERNKRDLLCECCQEEKEEL